MAAAAEAEALKNQWAVTIAIVDAGGHLLWLQRLDGAAPVSAAIAPAKARTSALGRRRSHRQKLHLVLSALRHAEADLGDRATLIHADTYTEALRELFELDPQAVEAVAGGEFPPPDDDSP
jgi:hypothetical protein